MKCFTFKSNTYKSICKTLIRTRKQNIRMFDSLYFDGIVEKNFFSCSLTIPA